MSSAFYLANDTTLATGLTFGPTAAGATSASQTFHLWNAKGTPGGSIANLSIQAVDPATGLDTGVAWLSETWLEARVNGGANPSADPTFIQQTSGWFPLGAGRVLLLPDLPGDCAYYIELRLHPPMKDGAPTASVNFELRTNYSESMLSLAGAISDLGQGIVTGVGDRTVTEWVEAPAVTATGTADAVVHVAKRWYVYNGISLRTYATDNLTLNQNDSAAVALTTGNEYKAVISQPPGDGTGDMAAVATKGLLAATGAGVVPAMPAGNLLIAVVNVAYHVTASVINQSDITVYAKDGRGKPSIGTGPTVNVAALRAVMPGARIINHSARAVTVVTASTNYIWLGSADAFTVTATATPPFAGAFPICSCVAGASTVTSVADLRTYFEPNARIVSLKSVLGFGEPRLFPKICTLRQEAAIANASYTDITVNGASADMLVLAVSGYWKVQPTGSTTADVGVSGTTTLYASAVSTVAAATFTGLKGGPIYYAAAPVIRVTPNAISAANGVLELCVTVMLIRNSATTRVGNVNVPYSWNLDRMIASVNAGYDTGATTFDVHTLPADTSLCPAGARPSIAPSDTVDASGYPNLTVSGPCSLGLFLSAVTAPGTGANDMPEDVQVDLVMYPIVKA